jgi:hypothetical protein
MTASSQKLQPKSKPDVQALIFKLEHGSLTLKNNSASDIYT